MAIYHSEVFHNAVRAFELFVHHYDDDDIRTAAAHHAEHPDAYPRIDTPSIFLQTYLDQWLLTGGGVEWSGSNYTTWLRVVVAAADAVLKGSVKCDYYGPTPPYPDPAVSYPRPIVAIFEDGSRGQDFLDPDYYAVAAYRWNNRPFGLLQCTDYFEAGPIMPGTISIRE